MAWFEAVRSDERCQMPCISNTGSQYPEPVTCNWCFLQCAAHCKPRSECEPDHKRRFLCTLLAEHFAETQPGTKKLHRALNVQVGKCGRGRDELCVDAHDRHATRNAGTEKTARADCTELRMNKRRFAACICRSVRAECEVTSHVPATATKRQDWWCKSST